MVTSHRLDLVLVLTLDSKLPHLRLMRQPLLMGYYIHLQLQRHYSEDETTENLFRYAQLVLNEFLVMYQSDSKLVTPLSSVRVVKHQMQSCSLQSGERIVAPTEVCLGYNPSAC